MWPSALPPSDRSEVALLSLFELHVHRTFALALTSLKLRACGLSLERLLFLNGRLKEHPVGRIVAVPRSDGRRAGRSAKESNGRYAASWPHEASRRAWLRRQQMLLFVTRSVPSRTTTFRLIRRRPVCAPRCSQTWTAGAALQKVEGVRLRLLRFCIGQER